MCFLTLQFLIIIFNLQLYLLIYQQIICTNYDLITSIKQKAIIDHSVVRGYFTDQSQSQNLFFPEPDTKKLSSALLYGWKQGLKTGMYYLRTKPASSALKFTIDANKVKAEERRKEAEKKKKTYVCNDEDGICVMCSG